MEALTPLQSRLSSSRTDAAGASLLAGRHCPHGSCGGCQPADGTRGAASRYAAFPSPDAPERRRGGPGGADRFHRVVLGAPALVCRIEPRRNKPRSGQRQQQPQQRRVVCAARKQRSVDAKVRSEQIRLSPSLRCQRAPPPL